MSHDFQPDIDAVQSIDAVPRILEVVCRTTGMGFSAVARVTEDRWICCAVRDEISFGLTPGGELKVETTICDEIRDAREAVVIDHVREDGQYCNHPTPAMYGFQSYISMPIIFADGRFFGTLCAIDPRPARLKTPEVVGMFRLFAELIATHLQALDRLTTTEAILLDERRTSELREQFIAVLGHDLKNPLASIDSGMRMVQKTDSPQQSAEIFSMMQNSVMRMSKLIDNVLDFARGKLGGGLSIDRSPQSLEPLLKQVIEELRSSSPGQKIESRIAVTELVNCDPIRIAQLVSNLLGNALTHGAETSPIRIEAATKDGMFELSVANSGDPIPPAAFRSLFQPFYRGTVRPSLQGLGLGLYISSEIAREHGGTLGVSSVPEETRFTFRMPVG